MSACNNGTCKCCPRCGCCTTCTCNRNLGFDEGASDMSCFKVMAGLAFVFLFFFCSCFKAMAGLKTTGDAGHNDNNSYTTKVDGNNNEVVFFATGVAKETRNTGAHTADYKDIGNGNGFFSDEA